MKQRWRKVSMIQENNFVILSIAKFFVFIVPEMTFFCNRVIKKLTSDVSAVDKDET